jgi:hypothetical protein
MNCRVGALLIAVALTGCSRPTGRGILDEDASYKIPAIKSAVAHKDKSAVKQLVTDLNNEDAAIRFYAIEGLRRLTGQTFDYRYYDDERDRQPAVQRWKAWLSEQN